MNIEKIPGSFNIPGLDARLLGEDDRLAIFGLLQACDDFSMFSSGKPSTEVDAREMLHDRPPGIAMEQKAVIGFFDEDEDLVAVLDYVTGYPHEDVWFIGLLLVHPDQRSRGFGRRITAAFEDWARSEKADALMIGVLEDNINALRFWRALGFEQTERLGPRTFGLKEHMVIRMRKSLD